MSRKLKRIYDDNGNLISKECSKCHKIKEVSEFSKHKGKKDGIDTVCKECRNKYYKENDGKKREQRRKIIRIYDDNGNLISKECRKCNEIKEVSEFNKDKKRKDGMQTICKECDHKRYVEYYEQNADKISEQHSEYYKQNTDKILEQQRKYYEQNTDKLLEYQSERYNSKVEQALIEIQAYVEKDPERFNYDQNKEIYGIIYLVYNNKSKRYYVGQTTMGFDIRYNKGWLHEHGYKDIVKSDLEAYGEDSFEYTKIFKVAHNQEELDKLEAYYIEYFNSYENGYNETRGNIFTERGKII